jgi:oligopeptide/dipeptide ABC transporter ATP-binding protein
MAGELLQVQEYSLTLKNAEDRRLPVLEQVTFSLQRGKTLGVAGESGSGKSVLALAILGLIARDSMVSQQGRIVFDGQDLLTLSESQLRTIRGRRISLVFQEPMTAMNPLMTLYDQIAESVETHLPHLSSREVAERVEKALKSAGFSHPATFFSSFPHQLSGGMRQRAMLAMALVLEPDLILADEPTTALDAALQIQLLGELKNLVREKGHSMVFISHDLGVIRTVADSLIILYAGQIMEMGPSAEVLSVPAHPYTKALVAAMPRLIRQAVLPQPIPGHLPAPDHKPQGCVFSDRCPQVKPDCRGAMPPYLPLTPERLVRCNYPLKGGS